MLLWGLCCSVWCEGFMLFSLMLPWGLCCSVWCRCGVMLLGLMSPWGLCCSVWCHHGVYVVWFDVTVGFKLFGLMSPWGLCCLVWWRLRINSVNVTRISVIRVYFVQVIFGVPHEMGRWHNTFVDIINHWHIEAVYINIEHMPWHWHKVVSAWGEMT